MVSLILSRVCHPNSVFHHQSKCSAGSTIIFTVVYFMCEIHDLLSELNRGIRVEHDMSSNTALTDVSSLVEHQQTVVL